MVKIPTAERRFYNTQKKLNTLGAYASELLPAAQNVQEMIKDQQKIKIDTLGVEARMRMSEATNEWRLANQSNPNDPAALKELQSQYDSILGEYRGQIDPMYRGQWDIAGNKLKGAFDFQNQEWGFKQRQENAKNDIARSVDNFYKLAYSYGQSGRMDEAMADFQVSYDKLLDYGAKNLGTEDAAMLLKDYKSNFYASYLDGLVENNPSQALKMLNSKEFSGILDPKDAMRYKKYAQTRQKQVNFQSYKNAYNEYMENPTKEGYDKLVEMNPNMSQKDKKNIESRLNEIPKYDAKTTNTAASKAQKGAEVFAKALEGGEELNEAWLERLAAYRKELYDMNKKGELSVDDADKMFGVAMKSLYDNVFAKQVSNVFGNASMFDNVASWGLTPHKTKEVQLIGLNALRETTTALLNGDVDKAKQIYSGAQKQAIRQRYGDFLIAKDGTKLSIADLKEGD